MGKTLLSQVDTYKREYLLVSSEQLECILHFRKFSLSVPLHDEKKIPENFKFL